MWISTFQQSVAYALEALRDQATITEAEVCATWCERHTVRIQYDAERPSRGVHTPPGADDRPRHAPRY